MKRILFALTVMAATLVSCSKDNGGNGDGSEKLVREITYRSTRGTTERVMTYEYDSQNRITRMIETYGVGDYPTECIYEYEEGSILELWGHKENGNWIEHICYKYYLDNDGYVVKVEGIENNEVLNGTRNLEYENGQLKVISEDGRDGLFYCYWYSDDSVFWTLPFSSPPLRPGGWYFPLPWGLRADYLQNMRQNFPPDETG